MRRVTVFLCAMTLLILGSDSMLPASLAQGPLAPVPAKDTEFVQAFRASKLPDDGLVLTVDNGYSKPDAAVPPLPADHTIEDVQREYGLIIRKFGAVSALAPATMTVLNTDPKGPNPFIGMPPGDAFKLLAGNLSPYQWAKIVSASGIGLSDLVTDEQRELFAAVFPNSHLYIEPHRVPDFGDHHTADHDGITDKIEMTQGELAQAKIKLQRTVSPQIDVKGNQYSARMKPRVLGSGKEYSALIEDYHKPDSAFGVAESAEVANDLKLSDLDYSAQSLNVQVDTSKAVNVGGLIDAISKITHLEIYADKRYEYKAVAVCSNLHRASAADLLRALALCVTGTYRKVGTAYVLSDDRNGYGTKVSTLVRFEKEADRGRKTAVDASGTVIATSHSIRDLPMRGNLDFTDEQVAQAMRTDLLHVNLITIFPNTPLSMTMTLDQLSTDQQAYVGLTAKLFAEEHARLHKLYPADYKTADTLDLQGSIMLITEPSAILMAPTLDGPVSLDSYLDSGLMNLFEPSQDAVFARMIATGIGMRKPHLAPVAPIVNLKAVFDQIPRRAVYAAPRTPEEVDELVASMTKLGLNELWIDVFSNGISHLEDLSVPTEAKNTTTKNILNEAIRAAKASSIKVVPVITLLDWGKNASDTAAELNLDGEDSQTAVPKGQYDHSLRTGSVEDPGAPAVKKNGVGFVDVNNPAVQAKLLALVHDLASNPGINEFVFRATIVPGYDRVSGPGRHYGLEITPFGYTEQSRLKFLRQYHADPIDLVGDIGEAVPVSANLPNFHKVPIEQTLGHQWNDYRLLSNRVFMQKVFVASQVPIPARSTPGHVPHVMIEQRTFVEHLSDYYAGWDGDLASIPALSTEIAYTGQGTDETAAKFAKTVSKTAMVDLGLSPYTDVNRLATMLNGSVVGKGWDGFVLNASGEPQNIYGYSNLAVAANPIAKLAKDTEGH